MRLELAGNMSTLPPLVVQLSDGVDFVPQDYIDLGYTNFDVLCIGAGGGAGGAIDTGNTGTQVRNFGGAGGGGGLHRVRGLLVALPALCPVVIGVGGDPGDDHFADPLLTTDGSDGGTTTFNDPTCRASGGKGGKRAQSNSVTVTTDADGGEGGAGDRSLAGGGAAGGIAGTPTATGVAMVEGTAGTDGTWDGTIGEGGGGGAGGVGTYLGVTCLLATAGGRGSYNVADTSVFGPNELPGNDDIPGSGATEIIPGGAGGAKPTPLNALPTPYGRSFGRPVVGENGFAVIRLTQV